MKGLSAPPLNQSDALRYVHKFYHTDAFGSHILLSYDVTLHDRIIHIDNDTNVDAVTCTATSMTLTLLDSTLPQVADWAVGDLVNGGIEWGCLASDNKPGTIKRKVTGKSLVGNTMTLTTEFTSMASFFKHSKVSFNTNRFVNTNSSSNATPAASRRLLAAEGTGNTDRIVSAKGFFSDIGHDIGHALSDVGHAVGGAVKDVGDALGDAVSGAGSALGHLVGDAGHLVGSKAIENAGSDITNEGNKLGNDVKSVGDAAGDAVEIATGTFSYSKTLSKDFSWHDTPGVTVPLFAGASASIKCDDCGVDLDVELEFDLDIKDYSVELAKAAVTGTASVTAGVDVSVQDSWSDSDTIPIFTVDGPGITFFLGPVPVVITSSLPITATFDVSIDAQASVALTGGVDGSVTMGVQYTSASGFGQIFDHTLSPTAKFTPSVTISGHANAGIGATVIIKADELLTAELSANPTLDASFTYSSDSTTCGGVAYSAAASVPISFTAGIDLSIAGHEILDKNFGPYKIADLGPWDILKPSCYNPWGTNPSSAAAGGDYSSDYDYGFGRRRLLAMADCPNSCSGSGSCVNSKCACFYGYYGADCSQKNITFMPDANITGNFISQHVRQKSGRCHSKCTVANDLKFCTAVNGVGSCPSGNYTAAEIDSAIGEFVTGLLRARGGTCVHATAQYFCNLFLPRCTPATARIVPQSYEHCTSNLQTCGVSEQFSEQLCRHQSGGKFATTAPKGAIMHTAPPAAPPVMNTCQMMSNLTTCAHLNGNSNITSFSNIFNSTSMADSFVGAQISNLTGACKEAARLYMCAQHLPSCVSNQTRMRMDYAVCTAFTAACNVSAPCKSSYMAAHVAQEPTSDPVTDVLAVKLAASITAATAANDSLNATQPVVIALAVLVAVLSLALVALAVVLVRNKRASRDASNTALC